MQRQNWRAAGERPGYGQHSAGAVPLRSQRRSSQKCGTAPAGRTVTEHLVWHPWAGPNIQPWSCTAPAGCKQLSYTQLDWWGTLDAPVSGCDPSYEKSDTSIKQADCFAAGCQQPCPQMPLGAATASGGSTTPSGHGAGTQKCPVLAPACPGCVVEWIQAEGGESSMYCAAQKAAPSISSAPAWGGTDLQRQTAVFSAISGVKQWCSLRCAEVINNCVYGGDFKKCLINLYCIFSFTALSLVNKNNLWSRGIW